MKTPRQNSPFPQGPNCKLPSPPGPQVGPTWPSEPAAPGLRDSNVDSQPGEGLVSQHKVTGGYTR